LRFRPRQYTEGLAALEEASVFGKKGRESEWSHLIFLIRQALTKKKYRVPSKTLAEKMMAVVQVSRGASEWSINGREEVRNFIKKCDETTILDSIFLLAKEMFDSIYIYKKPRYLAGAFLIVRPDGTLKADYFSSMNAEELYREPEWFMMEASKWIQETFPSERIDLVWLFYFHLFSRIEDANYAGERINNRLNKLRSFLEIEFQKLEDLYYQRWVGSVEAPVKQILLPDSIIRFIHRQDLKNSDNSAMQKKMQTLYPTYCLAVSYKINPPRIFLL